MRRAFSVGLGSPYVETISTQMILIIAIGIGIPLILLLVGFIWMACRRRRQPDYEELFSSPYGSIQT
jgi:TM2 domain-containing membrane protein YozV